MNDKISLDLPIVSTIYPIKYYLPEKKPIGLIILLFNYTTQKLGKVLIAQAIQNRIGVCHINTEINSNKIKSLLEKEKDKWIVQFPIPWIWGCLGYDSSLPYQLTCQWRKIGIFYPNMAFHFNPTHLTDFPSTIQRAHFYTLIWLDVNFYRKQISWDLYHLIGNSPGKYQAKNRHTKLLHSFSSDYSNKEKYDYITSETLKKIFTILIYH